MRRHITCCVIGSLAGLMALGCSQPEPEAEAEAERDTTTESTVVSSAPASANEWYLRTRSLDLTGDGEPDSVRLEATGAPLDSLAIALTFVVRGAEELRERWGSSDELTIADSAMRSGARGEAYLRAQLDSVLASVVVVSMSAPGVRLMAEDSAILAGVSPRPTHRISFSYGYETTVRLVWDGPQERFVRLFSCC